MADDDEWGSSGAPSGDDFFLDGENVSQDDVGGAGFLNKPGWYHMEIVDVKRELNTLNKDGKEKAPSIEFDMVVQETVPGQCPAGTRHRHTIYIAGKGGNPISDGSRNKCFRFGLGLKLLEEKQFEGKDKPSIVVAGTTQSRIPISLWDKAKGMHLCGKIVFEEGKDGFRDKYVFDYDRVYLPNDPAAEDCPKNMEILKALGFGDVNPGKKGGEATGGKATSKAPPATSKDAGNARKDAPKSETKKETPLPADAGGVDLDDL